jgi:hypothetical protein
MPRSMRLLVGAGFALLVAVLAACAPRPLPANVRIGGAPRIPPAPLAAPNAPPRIVRIWLSSTTVAPYQRWNGTITTTTNVASVEARTETFSYSVPRTAFGQFAFHYTLPELPPPVRRYYVLWIIARNAAGEQAVEGIPIWLK